MKLMSFWSKFLIAFAITILATSGAVVGVLSGQKEQIDMGGSIKYTVPYFTVEFINYDDTIFETQQVAYGQDAVAPANNPTRTGYTFKGWTDYTNITSNRRVASQWEANKYHVTYNPNGGTGNNYVVEVTYGQPFIALDVTDTNLGYTRTGYTFSHWTESSNGGVSWAGYIGNAWTWTYTHDITLYAQWTANKYQVTYSPNGGTGNNYVVEVTYGQPFVCLDNADSHIGFTKKGHSFSHWIGNNGSNWNGWVGKAWTWAYAYDVILYAQWSPNTYTVKYDANGGSGTMSDTTVKFGENITISANTYTRVGYTYDRWLEQYPDGMRDNGWTGWSGRWQWDDGEYSITNRTLTLYASWTLNDSYLRKDWQTALTDANSNFTQANIKTISFVKTAPTDSGYTQVSVGATASAGTTAFVAGTAGVSDVIAYVKSNSSDSTKYDIVFYSPYTIYAPTDSSYLFSNYSYSKLYTYLASISFENFNTSKVTDMSGMFSGCFALTSLDVSNFNTSNVTNMSEMFAGNTTFYSGNMDLKTINISNFDTSKVTDMSYMFAGCSSLTSLDVSNLDTSRVTSMRAMFRNCFSLTSLDLSNFDTRMVTDMSSMFQLCTALTSLNISTFDTSKVTDMSYMFSDCSSLSSLNFSNFDTSSVLYIHFMFSDCSKLTSLNVSTFDTSKVTYMRGIFSKCSALTSLDLSSFNTSKVTDTNGMFRGCSALTSLDVSNFNTSNVTDMAYMFYDCSTLTSLNLSSFDMSNVTNTDEMLYGCSELTTIQTPKAIGSKAVDLPTKAGYSWFDQSNSNNTYTLITSTCTNKTLNLIAVWSSYLKHHWWPSESNGYLLDELASVKYISFTHIKPTTYTRVYSCGATDISGETEWSSSAQCFDVEAYFIAIPNTSYYELKFYSPGKIYAPTDSSGLFALLYHVENSGGALASGYTYNFRNLEKISFTELKTDYTTNMSYLFAGLTSLKIIDFGSINTSNVTDMSFMFGPTESFSDEENYSNAYDRWTLGCILLESVDLSKLNTSNVTNMRGMFAYTDISYLNFSTFNTSKVTDMYGMFAGVRTENYNNSDIFELNLSSFSTSSVSNMSYMFYNIDGIDILNISSFSINATQRTNFLYEEPKAIASAGDIDSNYECFTLKKILLPKSISRSFYLPNTNECYWVKEGTTSPNLKTITSAQNSQTVVRLKPSEIPSFTIYINSNYASNSVYRVSSYVGAPGYLTSGSKIYYGDNIKIYQKNQYWWNMSGGNASISTSYFNLSDQIYNASNAKTTITVISDVYLYTSRNQTWRSTTMSGSTSKEGGKRTVVIGWQGTCDSYSVASLISAGAKVSMDIRATLSSTGSDSSTLSTDGGGQTSLHPKRGAYTADIRFYIQSNGVSIDFAGGLGAYQAQAFVSNVKVYI